MQFEGNVINFNTEELPKEQFLYFTKKLLIEVNNAAIREKRSRVIRKERLEELDDNKLFIVIKEMYHKSGEMRLGIKFKDGIGFLDVSVLRYQSLPVGKVVSEGKIILEDPKETEAKRPYRDEREWQETVVRKPVRKQFNFRKEVLNAYSNQCAVCSVNVEKLLRAAHILPVTESSDDSVNNGICLCTNHEIAFDNNLLIIKPNGDIITTDDEIKVEYNKIRYPKNIKDYPSQKNLLIRYNKSNNKK